MTQAVSAISALIDVVRVRLAAGKSVRRRLPDGGRLNIDHAVPFLCVYRAPIDRADPGTAELVRMQASYLTATADPQRHSEIAQLVDGVVQVLADATGACLVLELWAGPDASQAPPRIRIVTPREATTVAVLADALRAMSTPFGILAVDVVTGDPSPPAARCLISRDRAAHAGILLVGLEMPPLYRSPDALYPLALRALSGELARALQRGFFEFTRVQTSAPPAHYQMMGRRRMLRAVRQADRELADIEASFDALLDVTPVNTAEAWQEFCASGQKRAPALRYRMLAVDPELVKRRLYDLPLERLEDPVLASLLRDKRRALDHQLALLEERDGPRFLPASIQLYGAVDDSLLAEAESILDTLRSTPDADVRPLCDGAGLAARARAELDCYAKVHAPLDVAVHLRDDIPGLIVSHGDLLVPQRLAVPARRVDALIQHEIGTHVVTYVNGSLQPLCVFAAGLAGYEPLQEGLGLFAEYLAGGLDQGRLRVIAARVLAVRRLLEGASFPAVVAEMTHRHGMPLRAAFDLAIRVFRGGGLTKDAIYLRGLLQLLAYLAGGGALEPLLVGKIAIEQVPLVEELVRRQILVPARLRPRWLDAVGARTRLARARAGLRPIDLIEPIAARSAG